MKILRFFLISLSAIVLVGGYSVTLQAQKKGCCGGQHGHGKHTKQGHSQDREVFHYLLDHRDQIQRDVTLRPDGVETLTESDDETVATKLQDHVLSMYRRVKEQRPIHRRDPLFAALFEQSDKINMQLEVTDKGVKVIETSDDPHVVRLIQAHARVVSAFLENGHAEVRKNHPVPN